MHNAARLGTQDPANEDDLDELKARHLNSVCEEKLRNFVRLDSQFRGYLSLQEAPDRAAWSIFWPLNRVHLGNSFNGLAWYLRVQSDGSCKERQLLS